MTVFREYQKVDVSSIGEELFRWLEEQLENPSQNFLVDKEDLNFDEDLTFWIKRCPSGTKALQFTGYVGTVPVNEDSFIEILPKVRLGSNSSDFEDKQKLFEMICALLEKVSHIQFAQESLHIQKQDSLLEKLIELFLKDVSKLVNYGLANQYIQVEENIPYLKGKILFQEQIQRNNGLLHSFYTQHDEFLPDRLENRIIKLALLTVKRYSKNKANLRLINNLLTSFAEVSSQVYRGDLNKTYCDREMKYYEKVLRWAEIILMYMMPLLFKTEAHDIKTPSLLFPMHRLFEAFVFKQLKNRYKNLSFNSQEHVQKLFDRIEPSVKIKNLTLRPDIVVRKDGKVVAVMDTKWKDLSSGKLKFSPADLYQMYVYGRKYFDDQPGVMFLIYPKSGNFNSLLGPLNFDASPRPNLKLYIAPFDFDKNDLDLGEYKLEDFFQLSIR